MNIHFLYGSETGTAEFLCEDLEEAVAEHGDTATTTGLDAITPADLDGETFYVFVSSTYGSGDVPTNALGFMDALNQKPDLAHVRFAVFGLGDRTFDLTFNGGSEQLMDGLKACGATMVGERGIFDNSAPELPEDIAVPWLVEILAAQRTLESAG